jgi:hypothetical protein
MPPNTVYVGRPTKWGNPFEPSRFMTREECVEAFRDVIMCPVCVEENREMAIKELGGKDLCCWCPLDKPCHADILLDLANELTTKEQT